MNRKKCPDLVVVVSGGDTLDDGTEECVTPTDEWVDIDRSSCCELVERGSGARKGRAEHVEEEEVFCRRGVGSALQEEDDIEGQMKVNELEGTDIWRSEDSVGEDGMEDNNVLTGSVANSGSGDLDVLLPWQEKGLVCFSGDILEG